MFLADKRLMLNVVRFATSSLSSVRVFRIACERASERTRRPFHMHTHIETCSVYASM